MKNHFLLEMVVRAILMAFLRTQSVIMHLTSLLREQSELEDCFSSSDCILCHFRSWDRGSESPWRAVSGPFPQGITYLENSLRREGLQTCYKSVFLLVYISSWKQLHDQLLKATTKSVNHFTWLFALKDTNSTPSFFSSCQNRSIRVYSPGTICLQKTEGAIMSPPHLQIASEI